MLAGLLQLRWSLWVVQQAVFLLQVLSPEESCATVVSDRDQNSPARTVAASPCCSPRHCIALAAALAGPCAPLPTPQRSAHLGTQRAGLISNSPAALQRLSHPLMADSIARFHTAMSRATSPLLPEVRAAALGCRNSALCCTP